MPKNKNIVNGFSLFMKEKKCEMNKGRSRNDQLRMADMPALTHTLWKALSDEERTYYNEEAKIVKRRNQEEGKLASDGIPLKVLLQEEEDERRRLNEMKTNVYQLVEDCDIDSLIRKKFYIISFNIMIATIDEEYVPNEIGISEYSIKDGILKSYHKFIEPGPVPTGYSFKAKQHSELTHKIPILEIFEQFEDDYQLIFKEVVDFLDQPDADKVMVFSYSDQLVQNEKCLDWLKAVANYNEPREFYFADICYLLDSLRNVSDSPFPAKVCSEDTFKCHTFDYISETCCQYHEDLDNPFCPLGYSRRLCFILSDALCHVFNIEPTPQHVPSRTFNYTALNWMPTLPLRPTSSRIDYPQKVLKPHIPTTIVTNAKSIFENDEELQYKGASSCIPSLPIRRKVYINGNSGSGGSQPAPLPGLRKPTTQSKLFNGKAVPNVGIGRGRKPPQQ